MLGQLIGKAADRFQLTFGRDGVLDMIGKPDPQLARGRRQRQPAGLQFVRGPGPERQWRFQDREKAGAIAIQVAIGLRPLLVP